MNPLALIVLLGIGVAAFSTMAKNFSGSNPEIKILGVRDFSLVLEGLQFNFFVQVTNPYPHELKYTQIISGVGYNGNKYLAVIPEGLAIAPKQNIYTFKAIIPYTKILSILPEISQRKLTKASISLFLEIQGSGFKVSDSRTFKLDSMAQSTGVTKK